MTEDELEDELLKKVRDLAAMYDWKCYHTHNSERSEPGWPDLVLTKKDRGTLFVELKSENGRLTKAQEFWLMQLSDSGYETHVWKPRHVNAVAWRLGPRGHRYDDVEDADLVASMCEVHRG